MAVLRIPVLSAVAYTPTMLFVPIEMAGVNIAVHVCFMLLSLGLLGLSPVLFLPTLVAGHLLMMVLHSRDPHLVSLGRARASWPQSSQNLAGVAGGVKFVP
jgi:hypothetical protein